MGMTAEELSERMSPQEFVEHWTDFRLNPWDEQRADLRSAMLASLLFNINRGKDTAARTPDDFMPFRYEKYDEADARKAFMKQQKKRRKR